MGSKYIADVSQLGLLSGLATHRGVLVGSAAVSVGATLGYGFVIDGYLQASSTSVSWNILWITLQLLLVLISGFVTAMAVGVFLFGDAWRRRVLLAQPVKPSATEGEEVEIDALRDHSMAFFGIAAMSVAAVYVLLLAATDWYIERYNEVGYYRTLLRSPVTGERISGLRALVDPVNSDSADDEALRDDIVAALSDPEPDVRVWAAWAAGHRDVLRAQPELLRVLTDREQRTDVRVEASHALGRLRDPEAERRMIAMLPGVVADGALSGGVITGLGLMASPAAVPALTGLLGTGEAALDARLYWAIRRARTTEPREAVMRAWASAPSDPARCAAAEAVKMVSTLADVEALRTAFRETGHDVLCAPVLHEERRYDDEEPVEPIVYVAEEPLRRKYLTAIFNIRPPGLAEFLAEVAWSADETDAMKVYADELYKALDRERFTPPRE